jgi:peptidoglycan/LPS O-acetylase OafA/YrhL
MKNQKLQIVTWAARAFIFGCMIIGGFLLAYLLGKETGEYNYIIAISATVGTVLGGVICLILSKWNKKRNGTIPDFDERTIKLMQRYLMIVLYVVLFGSAAVLLTLYSMGVHSIATGMLIVYMGGLFMLIVVGAIITKCL